jgi:hypothetical protein
MTALASVTIDRSNLSLSDIVIDSEGFNTYYIDKAGLGRVGRAPRETFADDSPWINGRFRTAVVLEESELVLTVRVQSTTSSGLDTALDALEDALAQFVYTVTVAVDGVSKTYTAYPATIQSTDGLVAVERVRAFCEDLSISIPVYPVAS